MVRDNPKGVSDERMRCLQGFSYNGWTFNDETPIGFELFRERGRDASKRQTLVVTFARLDDGAPRSLGQQWRRFYDILAEETVRYDRA